MGDSAHERFIHNKDKQTSRMDEVIAELESTTNNKRGSSVANSGDISFESGGMSTTEMMNASQEFDVEPSIESKEESEISYMLNNQDSVEALDESYEAITGVLESQSWNSLENNPLYDDGFIVHLGSLRNYLSDQVSDQEHTVVSAPGSKSDELLCEREGQDYVVTIPQTEVYDPVEDIERTLGVLSTESTEETGARLKLLDMYAQGAEINETAAELGNEFENIYEVDEEFRNEGLLDDEGLTEKGLHVYGTVVAQYEELEG